MASYDEDVKDHQLHMIDPSGTVHRYFGCAAGKGRQGAKTEIEKLDLNALTCADAVKEAVKIILMMRDESKDKPCEIEVSGEAYLLLLFIFHFFFSQWSSLLDVCALEISAHRLVPASSKLRRSASSLTESSKERMMKQSRKLRSGRKNSWKRTKTWTRTKTRPRGAQDCFCA